MWNAWITRPVIIFTGPSNPEFNRFFVISENKNHLESIDVLRAIAIIAVFFYHAKWGYGHAEYDTNGLLVFHSFKELMLILSPTGFGWTGVELFLLISGFLIHNGYLAGEQQGKELNVWNFYSKRFWRIFPPYFLVLVFFAFGSNPLRYLYDFNILKDFLLHVFFLHNLSESSFFTINPAFWSLALEIQLYLIYPLLLMIRKRFGMGTTFWMLLGLSFVLAGIGFAWKGYQEHLPYDASVFKFWIVWAAGAYLAEKFRNKERIFPKFSLLISLLLFVGLMASKAFLIGSKFQLYFCTFAWLAFFDWFINSVYISGSLHKPIFKFLSVIGVCSYSIYLIHQPFLLDMIEYLWPWWKGSLGMFVKSSLVFLILFFLSYGMYVFVEQPSIAFGAKLRAKKKSMQH